MALCATLLSLGMLSGCGSDDMDALVMSKDVTYTGVEMDITEVEKGDISPVFEQVIELQGYEETTYRVEKDKAEDLEFMYKATMDKVNVSDVQNVAKKTFVREKSTAGFLVKE